MDAQPLGFFAVQYRGPSTPVKVLRKFFLTLFAEAQACSEALLLWRALEPAD